MYNFYACGSDSAFKWTANITFKRRCATTSLKLHRRSSTKCMNIIRIVVVVVHVLFTSDSETIILFSCNETISYRMYASFAFDFTNTTCSDWALGSFTDTTPSRT